MNGSVEFVDSGCWRGLQCWLQAGQPPMTDLRAAVVEALQPYIEVDPAIESNEWALAQHYNAEMALNKVLDTLADRAIPLYDAGGIAPAYYVDDEPDEDTIWVVDLAVLRGDTE